MKFEKGMQQLSAIIAQLEEGGLSLEEAVTLYGKGAKIAADCQKELEKAKLTVTEYQNTMNLKKEDTQHDTDSL